MLMPCIVAAMAGEAPLNHILHAVKGDRDKWRYPFIRCLMPCRVVAMAGETTIFTTTFRAE